MKFKLDHEAQHWVWAAWFLALEVEWSIQILIFEVAGNNVYDLSDCSELHPKPRKKQKLTNCYAN